MKKIAALFIAILFIVSCAGVQEVNKEVKLTPDYSGKWTGQSLIEAQGMTDTLDMSLIHESGVITGVISDTQGFLSNAPLINVVLKEKTLTFSFIASTPMGNMQVNSIGIFSEDSRELALTFIVPDMNMTGNAKLLKS